MVKPRTKAEIVESVKQQRMAFFAQKREILFINALTALLRRGDIKTENTKDNILLAVKYADESFKALYVNPAEEEQVAGE